MSFLAPDYHDKRLSLSKDDLKEIRRQAWKLWFGNRWNPLIYVIAIIAVNAIFDYALGWLKNSVGRLGFWHWLAAGAVFVVAIYAMILLLQRWRFAPLVRRIIRDQGFDIDPKTGKWREPVDSQL